MTRSRFGANHLTLTVYTKPACVQCTATIRALNAAHIPHATIDLTESDTSMERVKALGYLQAPVVITDDGEHWSGFRPDLINDLATRIKENNA